MESSVEPSRSQNITVSCRRSAAAAGVPSENGAITAALPLSFRAAIAASRRRRWPTEAMPRSLRPSPR